MQMLCPQASLAGREVFEDVFEFILGEVRPVHLRIRFLHVAREQGEEIRAPVRVFPRAGADQEVYFREIFCPGVLLQVGDRKFCPLSPVPCSLFPVAAVRELLRLTPDPRRSRPETLVTVRGGSR